jgi:hypothetical protein
LAKYLGEGTSREKAEQKCSAFFICCTLIFLTRRLRKKAFRGEKYDPQRLKARSKQSVYRSAAAPPKSRDKVEFFRNLLERAPPTDKFWRITLKTMPKIVRSRADQAGGQLFSPV